MVRSAQTYFYLILIIISGVFLFESLKIPVKDEFISSPQFLPLLLSVSMLVLGVIILLREIRSNQEYKVLPDNMVHFFGFVILIFLYVFFMSILSFTITTFLFLIISFLFFKATNLWKGILIALGFVISIMLIFERVFHIIFP